ncbi:MAG: hypothetical protein RLZZ214_2413 [Verrucomicrobiota bacterium]|jgi:DUF1365 family protein
MNSLYECSVAHCRLRPKRHAFDYRVFMFCVDLDELPKLRVSGFSHNRFNLFSIDDRDHVALGHPGGIRGNLIAWLAGQGIACPNDARIRLVTFPRVLGYGFNPVSFFYIDSRDGQPLAVVAEVVNTFREMKLYVIQSAGADGRWHRRVAKDFYVSPFSDPGMQFDFTLGAPAEKWRVNIDTYDGVERVLLSSIRGEQRELSSARLVWYAFKYPLLSLRIIGLIHWHAFLLWVRRVPFLRKSERLEAQQDVMRPHSSLKHKTP